MEKDINADAAARQELVKRGVRGVPSFLIGDDMVVGLDKDKILQLVDHRTIQCSQCQANLRVPLDKGAIKVTCPRCKNSFDWSPA